MNAKKIAPAEQIRKPDIFSYHDYVLFLTDWLNYKRAVQSKFSMRSLAKQSGLASGYLPMILNRSRPLSAAALAKMLPYLGLNPNEQSFLDALLILGTSDSHEARVAALERMRRFAQFRSQNGQNSEVSQYLTHWYYVAIREMAANKEFRAEPEWIQERLRFQVPLKEIKDTLDFLFENKYLEKSADGSVKPPEKNMDCSWGVYRVALAEFHREIMRLAAESIEKVPSEERNIMGHTFSLDSADFKKAKAIADNAVKEIQALEKKGTRGESVYHFEVALFPLSGQKRSST